MPRDHEEKAKYVPEDIEDGEHLWLWRAWNDDWSLICDCGVVRAPSLDRAKELAWMCVGGPNMSKIAHVILERII